MYILRVEDLPWTRTKVRRQGRQRLPVPESQGKSAWSEVRPILRSKTKAQKIKWTTAWRRHNRKTNQNDAGKKKKKKVFRKERAIEGVTLESIRKLKTAKPEDKKALAQEAILEIKDRKKTQIEKKRSERKGTDKTRAQQAKVQDKISQKTNKKATGGKPKK